MTSSAPLTTSQWTPTGDDSSEYSHDDYNEKTGLMSEYLADIYGHIKQKDHLAAFMNYVHHVSRRTATIRPYEWMAPAARFLVPTFVNDIWSLRLPPHAASAPNVRSANPQHPSNSNSIRCLDGLRGLACFLVFNFHFFYPYTNMTLTSYGAPHPIYPEITSSYIHQLPFLSLFYRGRAMVTVFFAISGYVLSRRALLLIHQKEGDSARKVLTSSVFRRALRLYLPPLFSMFFVMLAVYFGAFLSEKQVYRNEDSPVPRFIQGTWEQHPPIFGTFYEQFWDWKDMCVIWSNPFNFDRYFSNYDPHTWTIPLEFRSSMILFMVLLGTASMKSIWRLLTTTAIAWYCLKTGRWETSVFLGGMVVCEIDIVGKTFERDTLPYHANAVTRNSTVRFLIGLTFKLALLTTSLYVLSYPDLDAEHAPGYMDLTFYTPEVYPMKDSYLFWHSICSIPLIWCITNLSTARKFLETRIIQYLGKISFSFYLVHGPILHSLGFRLLPAIWNVLGYQGKDEITFPSDDTPVEQRLPIDYGKGNVAFVTGLLLGYLVCLAIALWLADIFWRVIDIPSTKFARKVEKLVSN